MKKPANKGGNGTPDSLRESLTKRLAQLEAEAAQIVQQATRQLAMYEGAIRLCKQELGLIPRGNNGQ